jgi:hypothetical protein
MGILPLPGRELRGGGSCGGTIALALAVSRFAFCGDLAAGPEIALGGGSRVRAAIG